MKSFQLEIPIDPDVDSVIQPMRRMPFGLRDKLSKKLDELVELLDLEIIVRAELMGFAHLCATKHSGLFVDLRQAYTAARRVRHPTQHS